MFFDTTKYVPVLVPRTSHAASTWDAFTYCYNVKVTSAMATDRGVVVFVPVTGAGNADNLRTLSKAARAPIVTAANPLFIIPDARPEEMAACGFDYRFSEGHPLHYIGKIERVVFVAAPPAPAAASHATLVEVDSAAHKIAFWFVRLSRRRMARGLENVRKQLSAETRAKDQQALQLKTTRGEIKTTRGQIKNTRKENQRLKKTCQATEKDRDLLLKTMQNVLSERDSARRERDDALKQAGEAEEAFQRMNAIPVATATETDASEAQEHKKAYDALSKFSRYGNLDQLVSFAHSHNKILKELLKSLVADNNRCAKQCLRLETDHHAKLESLKKTLKAMQIQVDGTKRFETYTRICAKLMEATGVKNGKQLETTLEPLYEIAQEFSDFGGRPPLVGFILWAKTMWGAFGKGKSQHLQVPKLFALYNELSKLNEGKNTVDALRVFNVAMEQNKCSGLSEASVKLAKPSTILDVGRYDASLAVRDLPEVWTKEDKRDLYHFCTYHTCGFTGGSSLLEMVLTLQDSQPLNIPQAGSRIHAVFQNVFDMMQQTTTHLDHHPLKTYEDFLRCVFLKCQAGWQKRPFMMKCKTASAAALASRALCLGAYQIGGVEVRNYQFTSGALARMAGVWPNYDQKDYDLLLKHEGDYLTQKHLFTLAALHEPLNNATFPWCTLHAYMQLENTDAIWNIVLYESMTDAKRVLTHIVGNRYVTNKQIATFREQCLALKSFKACYSEDDPNPQKITMNKYLTIEVSGPRWEQSVAVQMGCPYPSVSTKDHEFWNFIYQWVGSEGCGFNCDWHVSVASSPAGDLTNWLATAKTPPASPKLKAVTPAEYFMQTVNAGLRKAREHGEMSKSDIAKVREKAESLQTKMKIVDLQGALERKDSLDEAIGACRKQAGDAFF